MGQQEEVAVSRFRPGDTVRVKSYQQGVEWRRPHIRTPGYIYGVKGRIVDACGKFGDPSFLAFGIEAPKIWLYRVVRENTFSSAPFFVGDVGFECFCNLQLMDFLFRFLLGNCYEGFMARTKLCEGYVEC